MNKDIEPEDIADLIVDQLDELTANELHLLAAHDENEQVCIEAFRPDSDEAAVFTITITKDTTP
jgi:hypothetical protein